LTRALIIHPGSDDVEVRDVETDLDSLQKLVGGDIQHLQLSSTTHAYINEYGKREKLALNFIATMLSELLDIGLMPGDDIVGTMVCFGTLWDGPGMVTDGNFDVPDQLVTLVRTIEEEARS
jgi:Domain of unknown function (DUF3846)